MKDPVAIKIVVNGVEREGIAEPRTTLADFLRDELGLTGTHIGCEHGVCGACTVVVNGQAVRACLMLAIQARDAQVSTIEGLAHGAELHPLQQALHERFGFQCGFCTPGVLMSMYAFLSENPRPSESEIRLALSGNLCRCTGYESIVDGVQLAVERSQGQPAAAPTSTR